MGENERVILIRGSAFEREVRATKEIRALTREGYLVTFMWWDRGKKINRSEQQEAGNFFKQIILRFRAPWGGKVFLFLPIWWCFVFFQLMVNKWDVAHAIQINSIPPAIIAGKLKRKPVVYEMLDVYEDNMALPKMVRDVLLKIDRLFMRLASGMVLADDGENEEVGGIPNHRVVTVYDSPPDSLQDAGISHRRGDTFNMFFAGLLSREKLLNLDKIVAAIKDIEKAKLIIAGYGDLVREIEEYCREMPEKVRFIGEISHAEVLQRSIEADLLFVLRSPVQRINKYICGTKLLEAMMCGKPILVNKGTSTANKVREENCGLIVDANNIDEIKSALIRLRDNPELCRELGVNARKAYERRYGWEIQEKRLLNLYQELVGGHGNERLPLTDRISP